jgi:DNA replication protein DnaC
MEIADMPPAVFDPSRFKTNAKVRAQYRRQLERLAADGKQVDCIEDAVDEAATNLAREGRASFVIYGEPQSGKTEMMICLTAKLLDDGRRFILHLLNDSVDLLGQNLRRFHKERFPDHSAPISAPSALSLK